MTSVEHHPARRSLGNLKWTRWTVSVLATAAACTSTEVVSSHPAAASGITAERVTAAVLYRQTQSIYGRVNVLGEKYDLAQIKLNKIKNEIIYAKNVVGGIEQHVLKDNAQLRADAIFAYVNNGSAQSNNPLFSSRATKSEATNIYNQFAEGDVGTTVARLKNYKILLTQERSILAGERRRAVGEAATAKKAFLVAQSLERSLQHELAQVKGKIAEYFQQRQAAAAAAAAGALRTARPQKGFRAPPPDSRANIAIRAALSLIGIPYVWGGASRSGVDCSGLIMLAYEAAGIFLPHYSGSQFFDTVRVPLFDIQPGDILFYGYHGDAHEGIYIGHDKMIQAEETGTLVQITPLWLGDSSLPLAGIGRPRA
jgi:cell wall-associated NlpC family hydrolase